MDLIRKVILGTYQILIRFRLLTFDRVQISKYLRQRKIRRSVQKLLTVRLGRWRFYKIRVQCEISSSHQLWEQVTFPRRQEEHLDFLISRE